MQALMGYGGSSSSEEEDTPKQGTKRKRDVEKEAENKKKPKLPPVDLDKKVTSSLVNQSHLQPTPTKIASPVNAKISPKLIPPQIARRRANISTIEHVQYDTNKIPD
eukprot:TRINITY_DN18149_c0_g1_i1.p1 TRINITY_DN18149_c0_g1~~TRINITY_DN18149_c0_g1_i1.p1  ORF type:complete len:107 (+),score=31.78 TRINITY_DN18149_c0_g1_i1:53-373(+)